MKQPKRPPKFAEIAAQVKPNTPAALVELLARQLERADDAAERIVEEGSVVRDPRGSVVPHPGIAIELGATKIAADLLSKHRNPRGRL